MVNRSHRGLCMRRISLSWAPVMLSVVLSTSLGLCALFAQDAPTNQPDPYPAELTPPPSRESLNPMDAPPSEDSERGFTMKATTWTLLSWRNDQDFDPSARYYDRDGQSQGQATTALRPTFHWQSDHSVKILYQPEMGWESWGAVNSSMPHPYGPNRLPGLSLRHRQIWGEYRGDQIELRAGLQPITEPSNLFLSHLTGGLRLRAKLKKVRYTLSLAQLPEDQFEGMTLGEDNWVNDTLIAGLKMNWSQGGMRLDVGGLWMRDHRVVDRPLKLGVGSLNLKWRSKAFKSRLAFAYQMGSWDKSGVGGIDQEIQSWGAQGGVSWRRGKLSLGTRFVLLSADDDHDGNAHWGGFFYTGQNDSKTLILTQDETRDRYDNLDERSATAWGSHFIHRAGLGVWDLSLGYQINSIFKTEMVWGLGWTLAPQNVLDERWMGVEGGLLNRFKLNRHATIFIHGQLFLPGRASAAMINDQDRAATQTLYGVQTGFIARF
jgi:hypothetical protein